MFLELNSASPFRSGLQIETSTSPEITGFAAFAPETVLQVDKLFALKNCRVPDQSIHRGLAISAFVQRTLPNRSASADLLRHQ